jgi:hypothetical protein
MKGLMWAFGIACVLCIWTALQEGKSARVAKVGASATPADHGPDAVGAWVAAEGFVKGRLKAPSTADFGGLADFQNPDDCVTYLGDGRYRVRGWVDAQNGFGAKIRTRWHCTVRNTGGANDWTYEEMQLGEDLSGRTHTSPGSATEVQAAGPPELPSGLKLIGICGGGKSPPLAILDDDDGRHTVRAGDAVGEGWVVRNVGNGGVILHHPKSGRTVAVP